MLLPCSCGLVFDSDDLAYDPAGCWHCPQCDRCHTAEDIATREMQAEEQARLQSVMDCNAL